MQRRESSGESYASRSHWLKLLGFKSYADYRASPIWARVRENVFMCKGRRCHLCGRRATQVHHTRYHRNDLLGKKLKFLQPICGICHRSIEFDGETKLSVTEAAAKFGDRRKVHVQNKIANEKGLKSELSFIEEARQEFISQHGHFREMMGRGP